MKWLVLVIAVAAGGYLAWASMFPSETVRYRLTIEATVDERPASGSGVIEVTRQDTTAIGSMGGTGFSVKGEAIGVDLGARGQFFALLRGPNIGRSEDRSFPPYLILEAFSGQLDKRTSVIEQMRTLNKLRPKTHLPTTLLPMLVRFRNINNPGSVEKVDPDNFAAIFGAGVKLQRAAIEITQDPVTTGISRRLPWLDALAKRGGALDGTRFPANNDLRSNLGSLAFRREGV
jgi:hypothetical protein